MPNKTNLMSGAALLLAGVGEIVVTRAPCPTCIAAITAGTTIIAHELGVRK